MRQKFSSNGIILLCLIGIFSLTACTKTINNPIINPNINADSSQSCIDACYVDTFHYETPKLYLFKGSQYVRCDILTNKYEDINAISKGYPGVPFTEIDASYVDTWHYPTPKLYLFRGNQYVRYDILTNTYEDINTIVKGYPNVPFSTIDAAYVDTWHYSTPKLYLFKGSQYVRYDILTNTYEDINTIAKGYPGVPFTTIDASYVDTWHFSTPKLYLFKGSQYVRYDILTNKYEDINTISKGYPGVPFCK